MVGMRIADVQEDIDHELISKEEIADIINHAAAQASEDYRGKNPLLVCVLKGAVNTLAAFSQAMSIPVQMDFMSLSSYGSGTESSGKITVRQDLSTDVRGRHVLIVEDIIDSGITLAWLVDELKRRGHPVRLIDNYTDTMGHAGAILVDQATGVRQGGTDPRGDGAAVAY